jgi:hypothetical protein
MAIYISYAVTITANALLLGPASIEAAKAKVFSHIEDILVSSKDWVFGGLPPNEV